MLKHISYLSTAFLVATMVVSGTNESQTVLAQMNPVTTTATGQVVTVEKISVTSPVNGPTVSNSITSTSVVTVTGQPAPKVTEPGIPSFFGSSQIVLPTIPGFTAAGVTIAPVNAGIVIPAVAPAQVTPPAVAN